LQRFPSIDLFGWDAQQLFTDPEMLQLTFPDELVDMLHGTSPPFRELLGG
jgi:hypothetical protein